MAAVVARYYNQIMRRALWSRSLSAVFALWFAFLVAEPFAAMHECPMQGGVLAISQMSMPRMEMPTGARGADQTPSKRQNPSHDAGHPPCTCVGDCAGAAAVGLPSEAASLAFAVQIVTPRDSWIAGDRYVPAWAQHVLPFQNGPPRA